MTEKGKIIPRRTTGVCAKHQRELANAEPVEVEATENRHGT